MPSQKFGASGYVCLSIALLLVTGATNRLHCQQVIATHHHQAQKPRLDIDIEQNS